MSLRERDLRAHVSMSDEDRGFLSALTGQMARDAAVLGQKEKSWKDRAEKLGKLSLSLASDSTVAAKDKEPLATMLGQMARDAAALGKIDPKWKTKGEKLGELARAISTAREVSPRSHGYDR